jgi:hypothetical protein
LGSIKTIIAEGGYSGQPIVDWAKQVFSRKLDIIKKMNNLRACLNFIEQ